MHSPDPQRTPAEARKALITQRLQIGSLVLAAIIFLNGVLDFSTRPGGLWPVAWIYAADFAIVLLVQLGSRYSSIRERPVRFAALAVMAWNALFCSYAMLSPTEIHALVGPSIVITTATALLLPWGTRAQSVTAVVCVMTYAGAFALSGRHPDLGTLYAFMSLLGGAAVSCVGAYLVERRGCLIDEQTESLREMNRLMREAGVRKDEFLASVSHELRTPLNVVLGYVDLLLDHSFGPLEAPQRDVLRRITTNASNLSHLINDLIDLSRIEAGRLSVDIDTVDLAPLFTDLSGTMDVLLNGHDVCFEASLAPHCTHVRADADRLKQIVSNLLVNAVKFTEHGAIRLRAERRPDGYVALSVKDTGIGIPATAQQAIFEPFRQVHDRRLRIPGAGIGLSISSRLAHLMGGSLVVESEPGRGSCFTLTLPGADASGDEDRGTAEPLRNVS